MRHDCDFDCGYIDALADGRLAAGTGETGEVRRKDINPLGTGCSGDACGRLVGGDSRDFRREEMLGLAPRLSKGVVDNRGMFWLYDG